MKDFFILIFLCVVCFFSLNNVHFMTKTRVGQPLGYFNSVPSDSLPPILANYLRNNNVRYAIYEIPNYVKDFLIYNKLYKHIYKSKSKLKYTVFLFDTQSYVEKDNMQYKLFYTKVKELVNKYQGAFNLFVIDENFSNEQILRVDKLAYKDFKEYCGSFCLVNPNNDTIFVYKRLSSTEIEALDAVFQHYYLDLR